MPHDWSMRTAHQKNYGIPTRADPTRCWLVNCEAAMGGSHKSHWDTGVCYHTLFSLGLGEMPSILWGNLTQFNQYASVVHLAHPKKWLVQIWNLKSEAITCWIPTLVHPPKKTSNSLPPKSWKSHQASNSKLQNPPSRITKRSKGWFFAGSRSMPIFSEMLEQGIKPVSTSTHWNLQLKTAWEVDDWKTKTQPGKCQTVLSIDLYREGIIWKLAAWQPCHPYPICASGPLAWRPWHKETIGRQGNRLPFNRKDVIKEQAEWETTTQNLQILSWKSLSRQNGGLIKGSLITIVPQEGLTDLLIVYNKIALGVAQMRLLETFFQTNNTWYTS